MKHVNKRCPVCNSTIKLTEHSWLNYLSVFWCPYCGKKLKKVRGKWGGVVGHYLEEL